MYYNFSNKKLNPFFSDVDDVDPSEVHKNSNLLKLIDVRQPEEFTGELGHVPFSELISLSNLTSKADSLPKDKSIVFICRSGARSAQAASYAKSIGYTNVYNMAGGMILWNELKLPTEK